MTTIAIAAAAISTAGTAVALLLVSGARHTSPRLAPIPGPLRTEPKELRR